jgi:hypothetical protein
LATNEVNVRSSFFGWVLAGLALSADVSAAKRLQDFRYFRALSIDLNGRMPTRDEIASFERDDFDETAWIDEKLRGPAYAERLRRVYMDLLRLEVGSAFQYVPGANVLRRQTVKDALGNDIYVYFRQGQRRARMETDGTFCLTQAESGLQYPRNQQGTGTPIPIANDVLDKYTRKVKPWWLYRDYRAANPVNRYDVTTWATEVPGFVPTAGLLNLPDKTPALDVRICAEEASPIETGTIFTSGRTTGPAKGEVPPAGRLDFPPLDSSYATANTGTAVACTSGLAFSMSADCGCGVGLERCLPGDGPGFDPGAFMLPTRTPLGYDLALDNVGQAESAWSRMWWGQELVHFLDYVFLEDRDFREVLTGRYSFVNGPLAQFYKHLAPTSLGTAGLSFNYVAPEPLFDPAAIPARILPHDVTRWEKIDDRGPYASGILTMPVFLTKYGSRRARAHVVWSAFACKDFVAENVQLTPSIEPNLMVRPGCQVCHATLEPLSSYFTRVQESTWTFLPPQFFPVENAKCAAADPTKMSGTCKTFYDPAFSTSKAAKLRGAYGSTANADAGPAGLAAELTRSTEFQACAAQSLTESFLGRSTTPDDAGLLRELARVFAASGYRMRALVTHLVRSDAYKKANNLTSSAWREEGASNLSSPGPDEEGAR